MAGENTVATLNGLFKTVYADKLQDLVPDFAILQKKVDFVASDKQVGAVYAQPVNLSHESGFSYLGTSGGVSALQNVSNGVMKEAQVTPSELVLRAQLSYASLARAATQGDRAFRKASAWKIEDMNNSMRKRLEIAMLYGQSGVGTVDVVTDLGAGLATISITAASWAGGIWAGAEGAFIDAFTGTAKNNAGTLKITKVDSDLRTLTVAYTGVIAADVASGDLIYFQSSAVNGGTYNEMAGLSKIISNSGSLFGIDAATYSLWKGSTVSSVGQISHAKLQDAVAKAVNKGLMERVLVLLSPRAWSVLNSDQAALRKYDSSFKAGKAENGFESLVYHSTNGIMEVVSHPMVKDGDGFIIPQDSVVRVGSIDVAFAAPGFDQEFFRLVDGFNAVEVQCMADQAIFLDHPAHAVLLSGITYS